MQFRFIVPVLLMVTVFIQVACQDGSVPGRSGTIELPSVSPTEELSGWAYKAWIGKVARLLRNGQGLTPADDLEALSRLKREEVIAHFMKEPVFSNTVLDFNLYFLGLKNGALQTEKGMFEGQAFVMPGAITSAREAYSGKDYLKLLDWEQRLFVNPLRKVPFPMEGQATPSPGAEAEAMREQHIQKGIASMNKLVALAEGGYNKNHGEICRVMLASDGPFNALSFAGVPGNLFLVLRGMPNWFGDVYLPCTSLGAVYKPVSDELAIARIRTMRAHFDKLVEFVRSLNPAQYLPATVMELKEAPLKELNMEGQVLQFNRGSFALLLNSSTNFNRKRAAFVFKRFFCDDLTPVAIESPALHARGAHASEPSCQACHYKLDPMAGFFKDLGYGGYPFHAQKQIMFDDMAVTDKDAYQSSWKAPEGAGRKWNIGYVRSLQFPSQNEYGETVEDLFGIIKRAPEVRRCIVKRLTQYVLGEAQFVDAGYLQYLAAEFEKESKADSSHAFRSALARLLTSNSFQQTDPQSSVCYDYAPGENPAGRPPCRVAKILENHCAQCHSSASSQGGLDLTAWIANAGQMGFKHFDSAGAQVPVKESFKRIAERLEHSNPKKRMPLGKFMPDIERAQLLLWANEYLQGGE
ncbi:MAG TPA: hypothetical protein VFV50_03920 [Bdellovibrionales bacterium]|nr:hypothetical protein [Bdellovibrionales bacterium]